jgi:hypothetical protein
VFTLLVCTRPHLCFPPVFPPAPILYMPVHICPFLPTAWVHSQSSNPWTVHTHLGVPLLAFLLGCHCSCPSVIHTHSPFIPVRGWLFAPILTYWPCAPLVVQSISCVHLFRSAFVHAYPLSFLPAIVLTHYHLHPYLPTADVHSRSSVLVLSVLVHVCLCPLLLAGIPWITYHT